jgi:phosphopantetheinyl transferase
LEKSGKSLLSDDEVSRFDRISHPARASRFLLGRIMLRRVLGNYLDTDPTTLTFRHNANGKPELGHTAPPNFGFNLSHSMSETVVAVASAQAVGVDLESIERADAAIRISQRFFSPMERQHLGTSGVDRPAHALMFWVIKECIAKANGSTVWEGLDFGPLSIKGQKIIFPTSREPGATKWSLACGTHRGKYRLAVAAKLARGSRGRPLTFRTHHLDSDNYHPGDFKPEFWS